MFPALDAFLSGRPDSYRQTFGGSAIGIDTTRGGAFAQDHWTPLSSVSLDMGIRLDADALPSELRVRNRQLEPRSADL